MVIISDFESEILGSNPSISAKIEDIIKCLTKDERFDNMVWVGKNYSIRDLKRDLAALAVMVHAGD